MSELQQKVSEAVSLAKAQDVSLEGFATMVVGEWNNAGPAAEWDAQGMSDPMKDPWGGVRFKALEELKAQYEADGHFDAARSIYPLFECLPGYKLCQAGTVQKATADFAVSKATFYSHLMPKGEQVNPAVKTGDDVHAAFAQDWTRVLDGYYALPASCDTVQKCVAYVTEISKNFLPRS